MERVGKVKVRWTCLTQRNCVVNSQSLISSCMELKHLYLLPPPWDQSTATASLELTPGLSPAFLSCRSGAQCLKNFNNFPHTRKVTISVTAPWFLKYFLKCCTNLHETQSHPASPWASEAFHLSHLFGPTGTMCHPYNGPIRRKETLKAATSIRFYESKIKNLIVCSYFPCETETCWEAVLRIDFRLVGQSLSVVILYVSAFRWRTSRQHSTLCCSQSVKRQIGHCGWHKEHWRPPLLAEPAVWRHWGHGDRR